MRISIFSLLFYGFSLLSPNLMANCPDELVIGNSDSESFIRYHGKEKSSITVFFEEVRIEHSSDDHIVIYFPEIQGPSTEQIAFFRQLEVQKNRFQDQLEAEMHLDGQQLLWCLQPAQLPGNNTISTQQIDLFELTENRLRLQLTFENSDGTSYKVVIHSQSLYPFSSTPTNLEGAIQFDKNSLPIQSGSVTYLPQNNELLIEGIYDQEGSIRGFGYTAVDFIPQEGSYKIPNYNWKDESAYVLQLNKKSKQWDVEIFKLAKQELPSLGFFPLPEPQLLKVNWNGATIVLKATLDEIWTAPRPQAMTIQIEDFMDEPSKIYRKIPPSEAQETPPYPVEFPDYSSATYSYCLRDTEIIRIQYKIQHHNGQGELIIKALETGITHIPHEVRSIPEEFKNPPFLPANLRFQTKNFLPKERSFSFEGTDISILYDQGEITIVASNPIQGEQKMKLNTAEGIYDIHQFHSVISSLDPSDSNIKYLVFFDLLLDPKTVTINEEQVSILKINPVVSRLKQKVTDETSEKTKKVLKAQLYGINNSLIGESMNAEGPIYYHLSPKRLESADYGENLHLKIRYD